MKHHQNEKDEFIVEDIDENFSTWLNKDYISPELRAKLSQAHVLILPYENFRGEKYNPFPVNTDTLFLYLKEALKSKYVANILIEDSDYCEVKIESKINRIGIFIISAVVLPLFLTILGNYIYDNYLKSDKSGNIKMEIKVIGEKKSKSFKFEGDPKHFKEISDEIQKLWNETE